MRKINFAVIFGAEEEHFYDTLISLQADAEKYLNKTFSHSSGASSQDFLGRSEKRIDILGINFRWVKGKSSCQKVFLVRPELKIKKIDFKEPLCLDAVWILHLPEKGERLLHRELSSFFEKSSVFQINPYPAAERADDKFCTYKFWSSADFPLPSTVLVSQGSPEKEIKAKIWKFLEKSKKKKNTSFYFQPNKGTEGRDVFRIEFEGNSFNNDSLERKWEEKIFPLLDNLLKEDNVICREERGNLFYFKENEKEKGLRRFVLRINVGYDGKDFIAESGFAQIAQDNKSFITSLEKGGEIRGINEVLANLYFLDNGKVSRFIPGHFEIEKMKKVAEVAILSLNKRLKKEGFLNFSGIDLLLEVDEKRNLVVVPLEVNPRPAGLSKAEEIEGISQVRPRAKITAALFELILKDLNRSGKCF